MKKRYFVPPDYNGVYEKSNKGPIFLAHCHNRKAARLIALAMNEQEARKRCGNCIAANWCRDCKTKRRTK